MPQADATEATGTSGLEDEELAGDGDRVSVTDVNGTVARFEMAYSPSESERFRFGPPTRQRLASLAFLSFASVMVATVLYGESGASSAALSHWIAEQDRGRPVGSLGLAFIILACALGTVARAQMRGLVIRADGVEARYLLTLGVPRICRWTWAQVERVIIDDDAVMFEMWNGEYERLPEVRDHEGLVALLERIAGGRKIRVTRLPNVAQRV